MVEAVVVDHQEEDVDLLEEEEDVEVDVMEEEEEVVEEDEVVGTLVLTQPCVCVSVCFLDMDTNRRHVHRLYHVTIAIVIVIRTT